MRDNTDLRLARRMTEADITGGETMKRSRVNFPIGRCFIMRIKLRAISAELICTENTPKV